MTMSSSSVAAGQKFGTSVLHCSVLLDVCKNRISCMLTAVCCAIRICTTSTWVRTIPNISCTIISGHPRTVTIIGACILGLCFPTICANILISEYVYRDARMWLAQDLVVFPCTGNHSTAASGVGACSYRVEQNTFSVQKVTLRPLAFCVVDTICIRFSPSSTLFDLLCAFLRGRFTVKTHIALIVKLARLSFIVSQTFVIIALKTSFAIIITAAGIFDV